MKNQSLEVSEITKLYKASDLQNQNTNLTDRISNQIKTADTGYDLRQPSFEAYSAAEDTANISHIEDLKYQKL